MSVPATGAPLWRITDRATFARFPGEGRRGRSGPLSVLVIPEPEGRGARVGYAIGRHAGGAVVRNRVRRRLRAALREAAIPPGAYLIRAGRDAADLPFSALAAHLTTCLTAAGVGADAGRGTRP